MHEDEDNDGKFPGESPVEVRYPAVPPRRRGAGSPVAGDRMIRFTTAAVVCAVAAFAAVVSYSHIYGLGRGLAEDWLNDAVKGFLPGPDPDAQRLGSSRASAVRAPQPSLSPSDRTASQRPFSCRTSSMSGAKRWRASAWTTPCLLPSPCRSSCRDRSAPIMTGRFRPLWTGRSARTSCTAGQSPGTGGRKCRTIRTPKRSCAATWSPCGSSTCS